MQYKQYNFVKISILRWVELMTMKNRMQEKIKSNPVLGNPNSDVAAISAEVHRLQSEAAKNPDHWINDGLKAHFEEENRKLELLKNGK